MDLYNASFKTHWNSFELEKQEIFLDWKEKENITPIKQFENKSKTTVEEGSWVISQFTGIKYNININYICMYTHTHPHTQNFLKLESKYTSSKWVPALTLGSLSRLVFSRAYLVRDRGTSPSGRPQEFEELHYRVWVGSRMVQCRTAWF